MSLETTVNDLTLAVTTLTTSVQDKRTVLDNAAQQAAASLTTTQGLQAQAATSAATAAAKATEATNNAAQITAYKTAAAALDTSTTATTAVTNLLPDMLAKKDPARHPFRKKMPTLVLDFERQKCHRYSPSTGFGETPLLPFMTFARNSSATYTGPDGLIKTAAANEARFDYDPLTGECKGLLVEEQRTNLFTYSTFRTAQTVNNAKLGRANVPSPLGALDAISLTEDASVDVWHNTYTASGTTSGGVYTYSAFLKAGTRTIVGLFVNSRMQTTIAFDLVNLTATKVSTDTVISYGMAAHANGWVRCWMTFTSNGGSVGCALLSGTSSFYYTGDGSSYAYIYGGQVEAGTFPTSYIPTPATFTGRASTATYLDANGVVQTAASGVARSNAYDYDSDGVLRPIGLLLEASATNLLLYSEQFDNAAWVKNGGGVASAPVVTANYGTAPDGQTTADRVVLALNAGTTLSDTCDITQTQTTVAGSTYTQSIWLKTADASSKVVQLSFAGENPKLVTVTGTWQRFSNTGVASDTQRNFRLALRGTTGTSDSADLLVWGAQQGVGSYPTSYIPTTSAQVTRAADTSTSAQATRAADDAKVDGTKFSDFYNQSQGTLVARGNLSDVTAGTPVSRTLVCVAGALDNLRVGSSSMGAVVLTNNAVIEAGNGSLWAQTAGAHAISVRIKKDDFATTRDGATVTTDTSCATPRVDIVRIGTTGINSGVLNGHVSRISYYPQPFTNEELQAATSA